MKLLCVCIVLMSLIFYAGCASDTAILSALDTAETASENSAAMLDEYHSIIMASYEQDRLEARDNAKKDYAALYDRIKAGDTTVTAETLARGIEILGNLEDEIASKEHQALEAFRIARMNIAGQKESIQLARDLIERRMRLSERAVEVMRTLKIITSATTGNETNITTTSDQAQGGTENGK